ncbi:MAG: hypothetical protein N839_0000930 [Desulfofustis sp. PB-SRB1]|jgi:hypothetical protein|nr:hypothetical protein [Desulfofustis sp. PB-SRB1]MBM1000952.1 hypothetical protein [Desulfofustis sp. PB-SRB1]HBH28410.1 hypothetical protein [Desulfofustis sp.]
MASKGGKAKPGIKFEVSRGGIGGIGIVCFCIFLWMFLFGVWAGQSLLKPTEPLTTNFDAGTISEEQPVLYMDESKKSKP